MKNLFNKSNWENNLFKSYYCLDCKQNKPCHILSKEYCCDCAYQLEQQKSQEYNNYEKVLTNKQRERKTAFQQLKLLKNYLGCKNCQSKEIDAYSLYEDSKLFCYPCLMKKEGGVSSLISFTEQSKWFKKYWGINLNEWLENFSCLPVNKNCADQWKKDKNHLNNCDCLEQKVQEIYLLFTNSLQENKEKLVNCSCKKSKKVRVSSDYATNCQGCEREISVASKKRVIKNRNDPKFWGLEIKEKVLCLVCLSKYQANMSASKKYAFNKYLKRGYV